MSGTVRFTEDQSTNLATLYGRALDARSPRPILDDPTAVDALARIDYDFDRFGMGTDEVIAVATRGRIIDDWARAFLAEHPEATVLHLGAGMDCRHRRLAPPPTVRWYDVDFPEVMALRAEVYPDLGEAVQVSSSVTDLRWLEQVPADRPGLVIAEGLTMYLEPDRGMALLRGLVDPLSEGEMVFDAYSRLGIRLQKLNPVVRRARATLRWGIDDPAAELGPLGVSVVERMIAKDIARALDVDRLSWRVRAQLRLLSSVPVLRELAQILRVRF